MRSHRTDRRHKGGCRGDHRQEERIERNALENDLVGQVSPNKMRRAKAEAKADKLRELLARVKARMFDE